MGAAFAALDWAATPLGPIGNWPQALKTGVALILRSPVPMTILWGPQGVMLYNAGYAHFAGTRHPGILGMPVCAAFPDVAAFNQNVLAVVLGGGTLTYRDQELTWTRNGVPEHFWLNLDYSPLVDDAGQVAGAIAIVIDTTGKVLAERHARGELGRLHSMFHEAPGFMALLTGKKHEFVLANKAYLDLVGQRDVLGKTVREVLPEAEEQGYIAHLDRVFGSGIAFNGAALPLTFAATATSPARQVFLDFVYQPVRDDKGVIDGVFVQGAEVTERVHAERTTRANELKFRVWAQAVPNHVWSARADGYLDWFNDRVYAYCGAAQGELDGDAWTSIVYQPDIADAAQRWAHALAEREVYETEFRIRRADGAYRWHLVRALPIFSDSGELLSWIGTNTDIDDHKGSSLALERLNSTLAEQVGARTAERDRMWRLSTDIMLVADFNAAIVAVNPAFSAVLGWDTDTVVGQSFMELVHPDDRAATLEQVASLGTGALTFRFENRYRRRDGGYSILSWSAAPDQQFIHAVGRDISAERQAAQAMRQTELALQQAQKMETIGKLTGGVAHDFNNLLQVISGNLQLLSKDVQGNPRAARRVQNAMAGVDRGARLASYLLAFGRRQALEPKVVKIGQFVIGMEDMLRRSLGEAIEIDTVIAGDLWNTLVDTAQVENALLNLAINARDAMEGSGTLTIEVGNALLDDLYASAHPEVAPGHYVALAVRDTGKGMTPEVLAHAFEPFFSTKPEGKGTGLGLSMVYGFVKQSGGHVKIDSEAGHGTTVRIYLPRSFNEEDAQARPVDAVYVGGTETILVAEDDDQVRATVVEMLTELGYRVLRASDAASALAVIDSGVHVDLLFTDVIMPGPLRSPELARRARERLPQLAVLFTSGYTQDAIVHGGRLDAGVELLGKPYTREALARKIRHVLANQRQLLAGLPDQPAVLPPAPLRVLLVEDEAAVGEITFEMLKLMGYGVEYVTDAQAALEAMARTPFDVMITDVGLPGLPGNVLAEKAREILPGLAVVFATGQIHPGVAPGDLVLNKPYDMHALMAVMQKIADRRV
ncbi:PAS domain S-box protein [Massilia sp. CCM 9210]|uniref:hybrid sensor histidine kinase/response regulator n=1 Tax=Massilia scottii TaxID=3057166 RepID=UPI0027965AF6|nr:PAS domain S-box protein [Massilia sp. CCM 9210]MDQ1811736.1 PAS domain S-box protein [Massilia sp. CCM 9210]